MTKSKMGKWSLLTFFSLFLFSTGTGFCDFNIFMHRKVIIGEFKNIEKGSYDYLAESLQTHFYNYSLMIPFLTITDEERAFLKHLSENDEYSEDFIVAGKSIGYRMIPYIEKGPFSMKNWPVYIYGSYTVFSEDNVHLAIYAYNSLTDRIDSEYSASLTLTILLSNPHEYLIPFFQNFLKYKTCRASFETEPQDSLIFIDGKPIGIGNVQNILLPAGYHRLSIKNDGFADHSDIFYIYEDGFFYRSVLKKAEKARSFSVNTDPPGAKVYLNEKFAGETPLDIEVSYDNFTLTLIKDGFKEEVINNIDLYIDNITQGKDAHAQKRINLKLFPIDKKKSQYEDADIYKKQAKVSAYAGFGMLGLSILLGVQKTLYDQKADLYKISMDEDRYRNSLSTADTLFYLTAASSAVTAGIFTFSFLRLLKYFTLYSSHPEYQRDNHGNSIKLLKKEVQF